MSAAATADQPVSLIETAVAYKLLFGREPRTAEELLSLASPEATVAQVRNALFASPEFAYAAQHYAPNHKPLDGERADVQVRVTPELLERMMRRTEEVFRRLGETEPHWAVLTNEKFRSDRIDKNKEEFFATGEYNVRILRAFADRAGVDLKRFETCFELGCGVGRITTWLAEMFPAVIAGDISPPLLDVARRSLDDFGRNNVQLVLLNTFAKLDALPRYDVFFTAITLQHNPPPIIYVLLSRLLEKLNPGGVALFQLSTYAAGYRFNAEEYLNTPPVGPGIEMHMLPQPVIFELLEQHDCRTLEVREDGSCGPKLDILSNIYFVQKGKRK